MKGCLKFIVIGIVILVIIGAISTLFNVDTENNEMTTSTEPETIEETSLEVEDNEKIELEEKTEEFNLSNLELVTEIKSKLDKCYISANKMLTLQGSALESEKLIGNKHYNDAYNLYLRLQKEADENLSRSKSKVISESLKTYAEIFNNRYAMSADYKAEIDFIKENLEKFPEDITQIEKDFEEGVFRVIIGNKSNMQISLPSEGSWCLMEVSGGNRLWIEGTIPNQGYGKFDVYTEQLPIFFGMEKEFIIHSTSGDLHLIFQECEKK